MIINRVYRRRDVTGFLKKHLPRSMVNDQMQVKLTMFGGLNAAQYGTRYGWDYVLGCFKRMYE